MIKTNTEVPTTKTNKEKFQSIASFHQSGNFRFIAIFHQIVNMREKRSIKQWGVG